MYDEGDRESRRKKLENVIRACKVRRDRKLGTKHTA